MTVPTIDYLYEKVAHKKVVRSNDLTTFNN